MIKTYSELMSIDSFIGRYRYLKLEGVVGEETFGFDRYINQLFYRSDEWHKIRNEVILRDNGCDLAHQDNPIYGRIFIHHINPINKRDILEHSEFVYDPEFLICCSKKVHDAIHYGDETLLNPELVVRTPGDTLLWRSK